MKVYQIAIICLGFPVGFAIAQAGPPFEMQNGGVLQFSSSDSVPKNMMITGDKWAVTIHPDGTIEYGKGYTPDAAAKIFWEAMATYRIKCEK